MTSDDFMQELKKRGYNVKYDDVVTVLLEPDTENTERLKTLIRDEIGWKNSFGIKYTGHPKWWDDPGDDRNLSDCSLIQNSRQEKKKIQERQAPKAPDRESAVQGPVQRKRKGRVSRKMQDMLEIENIPGQMSLFDYLPDTTIGK